MFCSFQGDPQHLKIYIMFSVVDLLYLSDVVQLWFGEDCTAIVFHWMLMLFPVFGASSIMVAETLTCAEKAWAGVSDLFHTFLFNLQAREPMFVEPHVQCMLFCTSIDFWLTNNTQMVDKIRLLSSPTLAEVLQYHVLYQKGLGGQILIWVFSILWYQYFNNLFWYIIIYFDIKSHFMIKLTESYVVICWTLNGSAIHDGGSLNLYTSDYNYLLYTMQ